MATTVSVPCPHGVYTQVSTLSDVYCLIHNPITRLDNGQRIRFHLGAAQPLVDTTDFMTLDEDEVFERPPALDGHIWVSPETSDFDIKVLEDT